MSIYSLSLNTTVTTTGAAAMDCKAAATNTPNIMEVGLSLGAATASTYGLGRAGNTPTQTAPVLLQAEDPSKPAALTGCAVAWSVAPTVPATKSVGPRQKSRWWRSLKRNNSGPY